MLSDNNIIYKIFSFLHGAIINFFSFIHKIVMSFHNPFIRGTSSIVFAVLLFLSYFELAGIFGIFVKSFLYQAFGIGYFVLIVYLFSIAYRATRHKHIKNPIRYNFGYLLFYFSTSVLAAWLSPQDSNAIFSGGSFGDWTINLFISWFGTFTLVFLPVILFVSLVMIGIINVKKIAYWATNRKMVDEPQEVDDDEWDDENEEEEDEDYEEEEDESYEEEEDEEEELEDCEEEERETQQTRIKLKIKKTQQNKKTKYKRPPVSILSSAKKTSSQSNTKENANIITRVMKNFNIDIVVEEITVGPTCTRYSIKPSQNVRLQKIIALQTNLELELASHPIRIEAPIPGKSLVGIEIPNTKRETVSLKELINSKEFKNSKFSLPVAIGKTISGETRVADITKMPHALVAGTTGSGKSVLLHTLIISLLYRYGPERLKFIMVDPKRVELTLYNGIGHLYTPTITNPKDAVKVLKWAASEMERRYEIFENHKIRDISAYHSKIESKGGEKLPFIVMIFDELADLMQTYPREIESGIIKLAQKSRAVGLHMILATQRPSVNVITGVVKANIPVRIALQVASQIDSRTILDSTGAEDLIGSGDLLFLNPELKKPERMQSAFVSDDEVKKISKVLQSIDPEMDPINLETKNVGSENSYTGSSDDNEDELLEQAEEIVIANKKASTSFLQRKLRIGYSRAARLIDTLEEKGVIGAQTGTKPREIFTSKED